MSVPMELVPLLPMPAPGTSKLAKELAAPLPSLGTPMVMEHQSKLPKPQTGKPHLRYFNSNMPGQLGNTLLFTGTSVI